MKSKVVKKKKSFNFTKLNIFSGLITKVRSHQDIDGEDLIEAPGKRFNWMRAVMILLVGVLVFILLWSVLRFLFSFLNAIQMYGKSIFLGELPSSVLYKDTFNFQVIKIPLIYLLVLLPVSLVLGFVLTKKIGFSTKEVAFGQKGDSRLTTIKEIKQQYTEIPEKEESFKGYGGIPISHYGHSYFIDTETVHNIIVGTSRSGKGQTFVLPLIDNLSRAEKKSSMIVNDPKGELYAASVDTLKKRGYDVYLLNMADGSQSMSYNPLSLIVKSWLQGDIEGGMQLVNSLTYTLYHDEHAGQNAWVNEGAQKAVNGMIISLIEYCVKNNQVEKITLNNVSDMLNELGTVEYQKNEDDPFNTTNVLDEYFKTLPQGNIAKKEFGSTSFAGDKAKSSIYSTIIQKLSVFSMPKNARMTSMNTLDFKTVGFPKYISFKMPESYYNKRIQLSFYDKEGTLKYSYTIKVGFGGFVEYNFDAKLATDDKVVIRYKNEESGETISSMFVLDLEHEDEHHQVELIKKVNKLGISNEKFVYSEKPVAVFMNVPDYDQSNNDLASMFVSQLYSELAKQCSFVAGGKTVTRVQFILDEFGNMIPIKDMAQIMTVSAGRNILFDLFLQSYAQLYNGYSKESGQTIKENGQNQILIKTSDKDTNAEFSEGAGKTTIENGNVNKSMLNINQSINVNADSMPLLTTERLGGMLEGEALILRPLHRQDLHHRRIRPFPIFNTKKTRMPYAYTFLNKWFNPANDPNMLDIYSPHSSLDLKTLAIGFSDFTKFDQKAEEAYRLSKSKATSDEIDEETMVNEFPDGDTNIGDESSIEVNNPNVQITSEATQNKLEAFVVRIKAMTENKRISKAQEEAFIESFETQNIANFRKTVSSLTDERDRIQLTKLFSQKK